MLHLKNVNFWTQPKLWGWRLPTTENTADQGKLLLVPTDKLLRALLEIHPMDHVMFAMTECQ